MLKDFLSDASHKKLTIGMYDMTAPHIVEAVEAIAGRKNTSITLTLDRQRGEGAHPDDTGGEARQKG